MAIITKDFHFEASHQLQYHAGKCASLHGHSYTGTVCISGPISDPWTGVSGAGMVADYNLVSEVISLLDHYHLNDILRTPSPTAEVIACHIFWEIQSYLGSQTEVLSVTLHETESSSATVHSSDVQLYRQYRQQQDAREGQFDNLAGPETSLEKIRERPSRASEASPNAPDLGNLRSDTPGRGSRRR